jgi:hypothetical protein
MKAKKAIVVKSVAKAATKKTVTKKAAVKKTAIKIVSKKPSPKPKAQTTRHFISIMEGKEMIENFQNQLIKNKISAKSFSIGREFDTSLFEVILKIKGVKKIRFTNAIANNEHTLVVTGVDANGYDLNLPASSNPNENIAKNLNLGKGGETATSTSEDGLGDMGDQCTNPDYKKTAP